MTFTRYATVIPAHLIRDRTDADTLHTQTMALYASAALPGEPGARRSGANILWRHEPVGVLVTADLAATDLPDGARTFLLEPPVQPGTQVTFTVTVDAISRVRGRDRPVTDVGAWVHTKTAHALTGVTVTGAGGFLVRRRGAPLEQVTLTGRATVADEQALTHLLRAGVGRSKTFGCGLLTLGTLQRTDRA